MKISSIRMHVVPYAYENLGHSRLHTPEAHFDDTVIVVETDDGHSGFGEACSLMPTYLAESAGSLRAGVELAAPALIGLDPREIGVVNAAMDGAARGHHAGKAALDMACWDLFGRSTGLPLSTLLGGRATDAVPFYRSIPCAEPAEMVETIASFRAEGCRVFQVKLGEGAGRDIERLRAVTAAAEPGDRYICDANRGWTLSDARRVVMEANKVDPAIDLYVEQPCETYEECVEVRRFCERPFVLDEVIDGIPDLIRAIGDGALDGLVVKLSHAGGVTRARELITTAVRAGVQVRVEDTVGSQLVRAAVAHLASVVPPPMLLAAYPHPTPLDLGPTDTSIDGGVIRPGSAPGLGCKLDAAVIGDPIAVFT